MHGTTIVAVRHNGRVALGGDGQVTMGGTVVNNVMGDEKVAAGDRVLTSGGDRVYPKGLPVGTVVKILPGEESFLKIRVKPAADLDRLEEVLVITRVQEQSPTVDESNGPVRAADILARRLPTVEPPKDTNPNAEPPSMAQFEAQQRAAKKAAEEQAKQQAGASVGPAAPGRSEQKPPASTHAPTASVPPQPANTTSPQPKKTLAPRVPPDSVNAPLSDVAINPRKPKSAAIPVVNATKPAANPTKETPQ